MVPHCVFIDMPPLQSKRIGKRAPFFAYSSKKSKSFAS
jgi:hypothetical protein